MKQFEGIQDSLHNTKKQLIHYTCYKETVAERKPQPEKIDYIKNEIRISRANLAF